MEVIKIYQNYMFNKIPHTQELYFDNGAVRIVEDVVSVQQGNWFHLLTADGTEYITNPNKILFVRIKPTIKNGKRP